MTSIEVFFLPLGSKREACGESRAWLERPSRPSLSSDRSARFPCPSSLPSILNNPESGKLLCPPLKGKAMEAGRRCPTPRSAVQLWATTSPCIPRARSLGQSAVLPPPAPLYLALLVTTNSAPFASSLLNCTWVLSLGQGQCQSC